MSTSLMLPLPESVQKMLSELLGKAVTVKKATTGSVSLTKPGVVAEYVFDSGATGALALCDLSLACFAGAALMLLPAGAAAESVKAAKLTDAIVDSVREVLNVCAGLFIHPDCPHVRLKTIHPLPGVHSAEVTQLLGKSPARLDLDVNIPGYGLGKLTLITS